jgi:hypothetical protein
MRYLALLMLLLATTPSLSADKYSCMNQPEHRQFDFWAGSWRVSNKQGDKTYGNNTITIEEGGCVLQERWHSASGGTGSSINYFDPGDGMWHQLWVDSGSSIIDIAGKLQDGSMVLAGTIYYLGDSRRADFRGTWTPLPDGSVRQFFEERDAQGEWQTWFDGYYHPTAVTKPRM